MIPHPYLWSRFEISLEYVQFAQLCYVGKYVMICQLRDMRYVWYAALRLR